MWEGRLPSLSCWGSPWVMGDLALCTVITRKVGGGMGEMTMQGIRKHSTRVVMCVSVSNTHTQRQ